jgi:hypothetical protein
MAMKRHIYFDSRWGSAWPKPEELERYFVAKPGHEWFYQDGNDSAGLRVEGLHGTAHLEMDGRIDARLDMWGNPRYGVLLICSKWGGGYRETFSSKGDLSKLHYLVRSLHGDPLPVGLFIPFRAAWPALKEFMETDGAQLPTSIDWIANRDLPANTFPDPGAGDRIVDLEEVLRRRP